jgi:hypothetical protein
MTDAGSIWESKRRRLQDLDDQLDQEREANQENRRIIAALTSRIPAIEASSETPGASETGEERQGRGELVRCGRGAVRCAEAVVEAELQVRARPED